MKKINLNYSEELDQVNYLEGYHRSGWSFVLNQLSKHHDPNAIKCDTYVDRTFHWFKPSFLPYTSEWIGIIHHTFNTSFSRHNNERLLKNVLFMDSLKYCKGLFVFSKENQKRFKKEFAKRYINVPVICLFHPTEFIPESEMFTLDKFFNNPNKRIVQIGAWLRNNYAIFRLNNGKPNLQISKHECLKKSALIGKNMENYYKPIDFFTRFQLHKHTNQKHLDPTGNDSSALFSSATKQKTQQQKQLYSIKGQKLVFKSNTTIDSNIHSKLTVNGFYPLEYYYQEPEPQPQPYPHPVPIPLPDPLDPIPAPYPYPVPLPPVPGPDGICRNVDDDSSNDAICRDVIPCTDPLSMRNKYTLGAIQMLQEYDNSVTLLYQQSNEMYDKLLSENVVFLNLIDAAAVNTILECIARNTPIIVNRLEAVTDVLGESYPLLYDSLDQVSQFTMEDIIEAHLYLCKLNKEPLKIENFIHSLLYSGIF